MPLYEALELLSVPADESEDYRRGYREGYQRAMAFVAKMRHEADTDYWHVKREDGAKLDLSVIRGNPDFEGASLEVLRRRPMVFNTPKIVRFTSVTNPACWARVLLSTKATPGETFKILEVAPGYHNESYAEDAPTTIITHESESVPA